MMMMKVLCVAVACMVLATPYAEAAISCDHVFGVLSPCFPYVQGYGFLTNECCNGVKALNANTQSTLDRQMACVCLKNFASFPTINLNLASGLFDKCAVSIQYKISPNADCSKVQLRILSNDELGVTKMNM